MFPSCIKSRNNIPRPTYLFAMDTTNRRFDSAKILFASSSFSAALLAYSNSSSLVSRLMRPISFRYILTGSFIFISFDKVNSSTMFSLVTSPLASSSLPSSDTISIPFSIKLLYKSSNVSLSISSPFNLSANCS